MMISYRDEALRRAQNQFLGYENEHRSKAHRYTKAALGCSDEVERKRLESLAEDSKRKAEVNLNQANDIKSVLDRPTENLIERTYAFAEICFPEGFTQTSQQSQVGVHFEEVAEMCEQIKSEDPKIQAAIEAAWAANKALGELLKETSNAPTLKIIDRLLFLDAICDQLVTATITGAQYYMAIPQALEEVNRSNYSKLVDGKMTIDPATNKWIKGPKYTPPFLKRFI